jgi:hypothetical protein
LAREFARLVENDRNFEVMMPPLFSTVCFRAKAEALRSTPALNRLNAWIHDTHVAHFDPRQQRSSLVRLCSPHSL